MPEDIHIRYVASYVNRGIGGAFRDYARLRTEQAALGRDMRALNRDIDTHTSRTRRLSLAMRELSGVFRQGIGETAKFRQILALLALPSTIALFGTLTQAVASLTAGVVTLTAGLTPLVGLMAGAGAAATGVKQAMIAWNLATSNLGKSSNDLGKIIQTSLIANGEDFRKLLEDLPPEAAKFARFLRSDFTPAFREIRDEAQKNIFGAMTDALKDLKSLMPTLRRGLIGTSEAFAGLIRLGAQMVGTRGWARDLGTQMQRNNRWIATAGASALRLADAFRHIIIAAGPLVTHIVNLGARFSYLFQQWAAAGRRSGQLSRFFKDTADTFDLLVTLAGSLGRALINILRVARPFGERMLRDITAAAQQFERWTASASGRNAIAEYFREAVGPTYEMARLLRDMAKGFINLGRSPGLEDLIRKLRTELGPVLGDLFQTLTREFAPALVDLFIAMARLLSTLAGGAGPLVTLVRLFTNLANGARRLLEIVPGLEHVFLVIFTASAALRAISFAASVVGIFKITDSLRKLGTVWDIVTGKAVAGSAVQGAAIQRAAAQAGAVTGRAGPGMLFGSQPRQFIGSQLRPGVQMIRTPTGVRFGQRTPGGGFTFIPQGEALMGPGFFAQQATGRGAGRFGGVRGALGGAGLPLGLAGLGLSIGGAALGGRAGGIMSNVGLGASLGSIGFAAGPLVGAITTLGGAVAGLGLSFLNTKKRIDATASSMANLHGAFDRSARATETAKFTADDLTRSNLNLKQAELGREEAHKAVANILRGLTPEQERAVKKTVEYRQAVLNAAFADQSWKEAVEAARDAMRADNRAKAEAARATKNLETRIKGTNQSFRNQIKEIVEVTAVGGRHGQLTVQNEERQRRIAAATKAYQEQMSQLADRMRQQGRPQLALYAQTAADLSKLIKGIPRLTDIKLVMDVSKWRNTPGGRAMDLVEKNRGNDIRVGVNFVIKTTGHLDPAVRRAVLRGDVSMGVARSQRGGGMIHGPANRDAVPIMAAGGEAILTGGGQQLVDQIAGPGAMDFVLANQPPHFQGGGRVPNYGKKYTPRQIAGFAHGAGFRGRDLYESIAIALAESGGYNIRGRADARDRGLWQINSRWHPEVSNREAFTPSLAARETYRISSHGRRWHPWHTYTSGAYRRFMGTARSATAGIGNVRGVPGAVSGLTELIGGAFERGLAAGRELTPGGILPDLFAALFGGSKKNPDDRIEPGKIPPGTTDRARAMLTRMQREAGRISSAGYSYKLGGGHVTPAPSRGPYDCSSAVSRVLQYGGFKIPTMVSSQFLNWGRSGKGKALTVAARPGQGAVGHVYMILLGRGWGTSENNRNGGPGWLSYNYVRSGFNARHPTGFRRGGRVPRFQTGGRVAWPRVFNPDTALNPLPGFTERPLEAIEFGRAVTFWTKRLRTALMGTTVKEIQGVIDRIQNEIQRLRRGGVTAGEREKIKRLRGAIGMARDVATAMPTGPRTRFDPLRRGLETTLERIEIGQQLKENLKRLTVKLSHMGLDALENVALKIRGEIRRLQRGGITAEERARIRRLRASISIADFAFGRRLGQRLGAAEFGQSLGELRLQGLELRQRIAGTFETGGAERAAFITANIIPSIEKELALLRRQQRFATKTKDVALLRETQLQIAAKQNELLQAQLSAQEITNSKLNDVVGALTFELGGERWSDLLQAGVGI